MTGCPYCAPDELCAIHQQAPDAQVIQRTPEIIVLPSQVYDLRHDGGDESDLFMGELAKSTGALVICVPDGKIETLMIEEAKRLLEEIIAHAEGRE